MSNKPKAWGLNHLSTVGICPLGLECLTQLDQLLIHQQRVLYMSRIDSDEQLNNRYIIKNIMGERVFVAVQNMNWLSQNCCEPFSQFDLRIYDNDNAEVVHVYRTLRCSSCCSPSCLQHIDVMAPPGIKSGFAVQQVSLLYPKYRIYNAEGDVVLKVRGPSCTCRCYKDITFRVLSAHGSRQIGTIAKKWKGLACETFTDANNNIGLTFPLDLDVNIKATLLGLTFLINFTCFEK